MIDEHPATTDAAGVLNKTMNQRMLYIIVAYGLTEYSLKVPPDTAEIILEQYVSRAIIASQRARPSGR